jgi:hypothetical protein
MRPRRARHEATRRDLLRRGVTMGGMALAAAAVPLPSTRRDAFAKPEGDAAILERAIRLEQSAVLAYESALKSGRLDERTERTVQLFHRHEQEHARALIAALEEMDGTPPEPPAPEQVAGLADLRTQREIVSFALGLEAMAVAAYFDALSRLEDSKLVQAAASIMASDGQHLVVLRQMLGEDPVPSAFEDGRE